MQIRGLTNSNNYLICLVYRDLMSRTSSGLTSFQSHDFLLLELLRDPLIFKFIKLATFLSSSSILLVQLIIYAV